MLWRLYLRKGTRPSNFDLIEDGNGPRMHRMPKTMLRDESSPTKLRMSYFDAGVKSSSCPSCSYKGIIDKIKNIRLKEKNEIHEARSKEVTTRNPLSSNRVKTCMQIDRSFLANSLIFEKEFKLLGIEDKKAKLKAGRGKSLTYDNNLLGISSPKEKRNEKITMLLERESKMPGTSRKPTRFSQIDLTKGMQNMSGSKEVVRARHKIEFQQNQTLPKDRNKYVKSFIHTSDSKENFRGRGGASSRSIFEPICPKTELKANKVLRVSENSVHEASIEEHTKNQIKIAMARLEARLTKEYHWTSELQEIQTLTKANILLTHKLKKHGANAMMKALKIIYLRTLCDSFQTIIKT